MLYPFPMVSGLITAAEESAAICTFDVIVFGLANNPFTNIEPGEITTVFAVPFMPTVTFPDEVGIATLLVPLEIALPACAGKFVKRLPSPIKYEPATLPLAVTFPAVLMFPADALPETLSKPVVLKLPADKFPVTVTLSGKPKVT